MNLQGQTFSLVGRDGMKMVLMTAVWNGRIVEADLYRASDMAPLETNTLRANLKGGH